MKPVVGKLLVHDGCRYEYTKPATNIITSKRQSSANSPSIEPSPKKLRSGKNNFNWKRDGFFCCEPVKFDSIHPDRCKHSRKVNGKEASVNMRDEILKQCEQRQDKCGKDVRARLAGAYDMVAEEVVYHSTCRVKLHDSESISSNKGRPVNTFLKCVFDQTCEWLENENNLFTLKDFEDQMKVFADREAVFGAKWIKKKLQEKYSDNIFFAEVAGRKNVICFKIMASYIASDTW